LALAKNNNTGRLSSLKKPDRSDFTSDSKRDDFITKCYGDLCKPLDNGELPEEVSEKFLGPHLIGSDMVQKSKLTQDERTWLDRPLSLAEIDIAAKKGKLRSGPGGDGFSNLLIIKCRHFKFVKNLKENLPRELNITLENQTHCHGWVTF
jgi:hypothetical protein